VITSVLTPTLAVYGRSSSRANAIDLPVAVIEKKGYAVGGAAVAEDTDEVPLGSTRDQLIVRYASKPKSCPCYAEDDAAKNAG
jgi:hypothetical protein